MHWRPSARRLSRWSTIAKLPSPVGGHWPIAFFYDIVTNAPTIDTQRWIPASEPPKKWGYELMSHAVSMNDFIGYSREDDALYLANWHEPTQRWLVDGESVDITHWMPLPEAPKEE